MLAATVVGATAAALSTAAASGDGLRGMAASVTALQAPVPDTALGMGGPEPLPADVAAEVPMNGRTLLAATAAKGRVATIQATRAARARQIALIEAARPKWLPPLPKGSYRISSSYGPRWGTTHGGLDMAAPFGTPIFAVADGVVLEPVGMNGYGNVAVIELADGTITLYAHSSKLLVEPGERIKAGQLIALVGSTGFSTGNHLHLEVRESLRGPQIEPVSWLADRGVAV